MAGRAPCCEHEVLYSAVLDGWRRSHSERNIVLLELAESERRTHIELEAACAAHEQIRAKAAAAVIQLGNLHDWQQGASALAQAKALRHIPAVTEHARGVEADRRVSHAFLFQPGSESTLARSDDLVASAPAQHRGGAVHAEVGGSSGAVRGVISVRASQLLDAWWSARAADMADKAQADEAAWLEVGN